MLNGLDLFSGIGGISYALRDYVRPIAYCEKDIYCQGVLLSRMADKSLPNSPIWDDITTLSGLPFNGSIDIVYGGFPCQDISIAGNRTGLEGERSGLFYEIMRLAEEIKPKFLFLENVPAITSCGGLQVVREVAEMGYDCKWCVISAASVGLPHKRERWFLLAHSKSERCKEERQPMRETQTQSRSNSNIEYEVQYKREESPFPFYRVDDVVSFRVDRAKALGNSVATRQAEKAFKMLMGLI